MKMIKRLLIFFLLVIAVILLSPYLLKLKFLSKYEGAENVLLSMRAQMLRSIGNDKGEINAYFPLEFGDIRHIAWSPDGSRLLAAGGRFTVAVRKIWSLYDVDLANHKLKRIGNYSGLDRINKIVFSSLGDFLAIEFSGSDNTYVDLFNYQTNTFVHLPFPKGNSFVSTSIADSPLAFLPDGKKLLFSGFDGKKNHLCIYDITTGTSVRLPLNLNIQEATWSPAGDKIVLTVAQNKKSIIVLSDASGSTASTLVDSGENYSVRFSPYGQQIAFLQKSPDGATSALGVVKIDGSEFALTPGIPGDANRLNWSSDGSQIFFDAQNDRGKSEIYTFFVAEHRIKRLTADGNNIAAISQPGGKHLAFLSDRLIPGIFAIHMSGQDGAEEERISGWILP